MVCVDTRLLDVRGAPTVTATPAFASVYTIRLITIFGVYRPDEYANRLLME
jgi:hypothetical protein